MTKIPLVIVDKREIVRQGLAKLLGAEPNLEVVCVASTGQEAVKQCGKHQPDVIIISCKLCECGGTEAIEYIHESLPRAKIIHFSDSETTDELVSATRAGVKAFLSPNISVDNLINAINLINKGEFILSPGISASLHIIFELFHRNRGVVGSESITLLTQREKAVLDLVKQGLANREIATTLFICENTVKVHLRNIMEKLHAHTRQQAVALVRGEALLPSVYQTDTKQV